MTSLVLNGLVSQPSSSAPSPTSPTTSIYSQTPAQPRRSSVRGSVIVVNGLGDPPPGVSYVDYLRTWSDADTARWLSENRCGHHADAFREHDIRGDVLLELDQATLKEMGIPSIGDRLRIMNAVKVLRQRCSQRSIPTPTSVNRPRVNVTTNGVNGDGTHKPGTNDQQQQISPSGRLGSRRLDGARPAPLRLNPLDRQGLPALVRDSAPDSARSARAHQPNTSTPLTAAQTQTPQTSTTSAAAAATPHTASSVRTIPPLPPAPRGQPPMPPPVRAPPRGLNVPSGRSTPTPSQVEPAPYVHQPLPLPPNTAPSQPGSSWTGSYGLPSDPRSGRPARPVSPLANANGTTSANANTTTNHPPRGSSRSASLLASHARNNSASSATGATAAKPSLPQRPSTSSNSHPYQLAPPAAAHAAHNLSPIAESFLSQGPSTPASTTPSYSVGRGPFASKGAGSSHAATPSLDDLRRRLVKFSLDMGTIQNNIEAGAQQTTINVTDCTGGVEVLEKALKKFGKLPKIDPDGSIMDYVSTAEGGLTLDGWGVYYSSNATTPMTEADIVAVCHAQPDDPTRHGLSLRRAGQAKRSKPLQNIFGEPSGQRNSPTSPRFGSTSPDPQYLAPSGSTSANMKRASSISILSGLGVRDPEKALEPPTSPTQSPAPPAPPTKSPLSATFRQTPSKLRNFFGQRPPSELITTHLHEYFPATSRKVLERTARNSMARNSLLGGPNAPWNRPPSSRFSTSTQGSQPRASTDSRISFAPNGELHVPDPPPRVSLSTEDGQSIDMTVEGDEHTTEEESPHILPPVNLPTESLSQSLEGVARDSMSTRSSTRASRRMSYMTELRSKRDRSDTASLMTVDQITAEVESRRDSVAFSTMESDDWTRVDAEEADVPKDSDEDLITEDTELVPEEDDDETVDNESVQEEEAGEEEEIKWIKGALIGAGSFGKVYLGMGASNGLLMAVKQVELPKGNTPNDERKKSMLTALEREIALLKNLQHENIVQYLSSSTDDEYLNIFLEYVPGGSITALLRNYGAFEEPLVRNFVRQILQGLKYLHDKDIIHRDIKGANILVDNKGSIKISDFGISKKASKESLMGGNRAHRPSLQGSVFWMAPEVVKQTAYTLKADIWSVGCLVVEMFTGEHPWAQLTQMQAIFKIGGSSARPPNPPDISADAESFLDRTFDLDYEKRPSAGELLVHPWIVGKPSKSEKKSASAKAAAASES
ncbi:Pkinase-domain-containing protein [Punctularia strigosozonata HHB-11173 SS5]|uniref:Pkinase-domain-containing protein n=1 Tax=Punctularia strigosozonata (strain HHB-11173) TaxID=741275 RepID=UPI0004417472|nr:Pkinase-domain-containing protein [Punctularia strigosozonata HHB-11173 SS5]EIN07318.1 Pkinase-domain-containing protein [Punctularia strigosozonata HHB-11173 SS5]